MKKNLLPLFPSKLSRENAHCHITKKSEATPPIVRSLDVETQRKSLARRCPELKDWPIFCSPKMLKVVRKMSFAGWHFELADGLPHATYRVGYEVLSVSANQIHAYAEAGGAKLADIYNRATRTSSIRPI